MCKVSKKNRQFRKEIFKTQCSNCEMYLNRDRFAKAIDIASRGVDAFLNEETGTGGYWDFDTCFRACIWKEIQEINRLTTQTKKRYHRNNPDAKWYSDEVKEVVL